LEASKWIFKSADQGNDKSQFQFGFMRELGFGIRKDKLEAFEWYMKSAYQKNGDAMWRVGLTYLTDDITQKDTSKVILWYKRALNHGSEHGCYHLIDLYEENKSELVELKLSNFFLESPDNIITGGFLSYEIAKCYLKRFIVEQDYYKAYHFIKKSIGKAYEDQKWFSIPAAFQSDIDPNDLMNMLKLVSEQGIADLEYNVGYAYEYGLRGDYSFNDILEANVSQAIDWYTIASNKGDSRADYRLGVIYEEGKTTEKNKFTAIDFYIKAIERGNGNVMYRLAHLYLRGKGIKQNFEKAYQLFRESHDMNQYCSCLFLKISRDPAHSDVLTYRPRAEISTEEDDQNKSLYYSNEKESNLLSLKMLEFVDHSGNVAVQYQLGCLYGNTESKDKGYSKGAYWLSLASQGGIPDAHYRLAILYEEVQGIKNDYSESLTLYQKAADKNHDKALYILARMYQYGLGTPINFSKALLLYMKSDGQGNEMAKKVITLLQAFPDDPSQTLTEKISALSNSEIDGILTMFDHLANNGETSLQFDLGYYYENKQPESDYTRAVKYYSMAKNSGHITATYHLGRLYELGLGIPQDYKCAANLYTIAKEGGCNEATFRLGNLYQNGLGVNIDYKQVFDNYTEASRQGNPDAQLKL
jgi:TPR repeat protein